MTDQITIKTNNHARELLCWYELPAGIGPEWFDYVTGEDQYSARFVNYRGSWYDVNDTDNGFGSGMPAVFAGWDSYVSDSFFSGVVFRFPCIDGRTDYESVVVGRYYS